MIGLQVSFNIFPLLLFFGFGYIHVHPCFVTLSLLSLTATLHERVFISVFIISMLITFTQIISPSSTLPCIAFFFTSRPRCACAHFTSLCIRLACDGGTGCVSSCPPSVLTDADTTGACPSKGARTESALWKDQSWEASEGVGGL